MTTCSEPGCNRDAHARGFCGRCYSYHYKRGTLPPKPTREETFWSKVDRSGGPDACWPWTAGRTGGGKGVKYGYVWWDGQMRPAHRIAWILTHGPIPDEADIDHVCRNPPCCNPDPRHIEPVTHRENVLRGTAPTAVNALKTHCPQGHEYTPENTLSHGKRPGRWCRICARERNRRNGEAWRRRQGMKKRIYSVARDNDLKRQATEAAPSPD